MNNKIRVLIVDDNQNFCTILSEHIGEQPDFEVVGIANNGLKAVEQIREKRPDIVVLDIIMPHLDGLGVLEKVREMGLIDDIKFIILSAVGQDNITRRAINLGATYYVIKPFDFDLFIDRLRQLSSSKAQVAAGGENGVHASASTLTSNFTSLEAQITDMINQIGVPPHIKGFQYLREAISMVYHDVNCLSKVTKQIYPGIAEKFSTTPSRVERAIRNAIEISIARGNESVIQQLFGLTLANKNGKITNSEFIAIVADRLRMENSATS